MMVLQVLGMSNLTETQEKQKRKMHNALFSHNMLVAITLCIISKKNEKYVRGVQRGIDKDNTWW